jgi:hypothetical protein
VHYPSALKGGVAKPALDPLGEVATRTDCPPTSKLVFDFSTELLRSQRVCDATYEHAVKEFGEQGVIDLVGCSATSSPSAGDERGALAATRIGDAALAPLPA